MTRVGSLHHIAVERIAGWIVGGRCGPGAFLPTEVEIGAELGVSRTVVREAMRTLVAKGMVIVRRRHGTQVTPLDNWSLFDAQVLDWRLKLGPDDAFIEDLIAFRLGVEPFAASLAARNPDFPAARLESAWERMVRATEGDGEWHPADLAFHETILLGAGNQFLRSLAPMITNTLRVSFSLSVLSLDDARASLSAHRAVADAILARDPQAAREGLIDVIRVAREEIFTHRHPESPPPPGQASAALR